MSSSVAASSSKRLGSPDRGIDKTKRYGPRFNPKKNLPKPTPMIKYGPLAPMSEQKYMIELPQYRPKNMMTVFDYLEMPSSFKSQHQKQSNKEANVVTVQVAQNMYQGGMEKSVSVGVVSGGINGDSIPVSRPDTRESTIDKILSLDGSNNPHNRVPTPIGSPSDEYAGFKQYNDIPFNTIDGITKWDMNQKILQENWQVIQKWGKQAREKGSLVGISYVGRKMQKIQPSIQVRIPGVDEAEPKIMKASLESLGLQAVNTSAEYANLSKWQMGFNNSENKLGHLNVVQSIVVRESLILQLDKLLNDIETIYYEYALLRLQSADLGLPSNTEQLVIKKSKIFQSQVELRVAFANYRTSTMQVFENFIKWRNICRKDVNMKDANIILMWQNENYLLKMTKDMTFLYKYSILRLWLEFEPNMLMLPPVQLASSNAYVNNYVNTAAAYDMGSNLSVTSNITGDNGRNPNDTFFNLPNNLPPLGQGQKMSIEDDDLMSQVSETSLIKWKTFYSEKYAEYHLWSNAHEMFLKEKRQEYLKRRRIEEKEERELEAKRNSIEYEIKKKRNIRAEERHDKEEKDKRDKNFKILRIHQKRVEAGEDPEFVKLTKSRDEILLDELEVQEKINADTYEKRLQLIETEEKAKRDSEYKAEKELKLFQLRQNEENRFETGIAKILNESTENIMSSVHMCHDDGLKEWQALRNICLASWKCNIAPDRTILADGTENFYGYDDSQQQTKWEQNKHACPIFWNNMELTPLVVEASIGFKELWPRDHSIVPPLPEKLFRKCCEIRRFLELEKQKLTKLKQQRSDSNFLRKNVENAKSLIYFDENGYINDDTSKAIDENNGAVSGLHIRYDDEDLTTEITRLRLKKRQESDAQLVDGTLRIYQEIANLDPKKTGTCGIKLLRSRAASGKYQLLKFKTITPDSSTMDINYKTTETNDVMNSASKVKYGTIVHDGDDVFAMTATEEEYEEGYSNPQLAVAVATIATEKNTIGINDNSIIEEKSSINNSDYDNNDNDNDMNNPMYNRTLTLDETLGGSTHPTGLDSVKVHGKQYIQSQSLVKSQRRFLDRDHDGAPIIRTEMQHKRPPDYTRPYWKFRLTQRIQACIRGMLVRLRRKKAHQQLIFMQSVLKIQAQFRKRVGIRLYNERKEDFQIEIQKLREKILLRHHSALTITKFVKWCGAYNCGQVALNPMLAYAKAAAASRKAAIEKRQRRATEYSQNANVTTTDGTSMTVRRSGSRGSSRGSSRSPSRSDSAANSHSPSRGVSCGTINGQAELGEFKEEDDGDMNSNSNSASVSTGSKSKSLAKSERDEIQRKIKLANIFKAETRSTSRLIPVKVKPGSVASQPGTSKPRFRPFAARNREFMHDVHRPIPEKTMKHPNDCYNPPPALLTNAEREKVAADMEARQALEQEDGIEIINANKFLHLKNIVKSAYLRKQREPGEADEKLEVEQLVPQSEKEI
jgi:hypothetical protein